MRQSKTTLKELTAAYRAVLRYGILCNAIALGLASAPAMAENIVKVGSDETPQTIAFGDNKQDGGYGLVYKLRKGTATYNPDLSVIDVVADENNEIKAKALWTDIQTFNPDHIHPQINVYGDAGTDLSLSAEDDFWLIVSRFSPVNIGTEQSPIGTLNLTEEALTAGGGSLIYVTSGNGAADADRQNLKIYANDVTMTAKNADETAGVAITGNEGRMTLVANNNLNINGNIEGYNTVYGGHSDMTFDINQNEGNTAKTTIVGNINAAKGSNVNIGLKGNESSITGDMLVSADGSTLPGGNINLQFGENGSITGNMTAQDKGTININADSKLTVNGNIKVTDDSTFNGENIDLTTTTEEHALFANGKNATATLTGDTIKVKSTATEAGIGSVVAYDDGQINLIGKDIDVSGTERGIVTWGTKNGQAFSKGGRVNVEGDTVKIHSDNDIAVLGMEYAGVSIKGNDVKISSNTTDRYAAVHSGNNTSAAPESDLDKTAYVEIVADDIDISANTIGVAAMSQGRVELVGNTKISAEDAIVARGDAKVYINKDVDSTLKMDGNVNFDYDESTSGTKIDADVDITMSGSESYWNGNTYASYDYTSVEPGEAKMTVDSVSLTMKDGATWNAKEITDVATHSYQSGDKTHYAGSYYVALNNLNVKDGTVNVEDAINGVFVDNLIADGLTINDDGVSTGNITVNKTLNTMNNKIDNHSGKLFLADGADVKTDFSLTGVGAHDDFIANGGLTLSGFGITSDSESATQTIAVAKEGSAVAVADGLRAYTTNAKYTAEALTGGDANKVQFTKDTSGVVGLKAAAADTAAGQVVYALTGDDTSVDENVDIAAADLLIKGAGVEDGDNSVTLGAKLAVADSASLTINDAKIDGTGEITNASGAELAVADSKLDVNVTNSGETTVTNTTLASGNTIENKLGGTMTILDSNVNAKVKNFGVLYSDPTYYGAEVVNEGTATFDGDTFESTGSLTNSAIVNLNNVEFKSGSVLTGLAGNVLNIAGTENKFNGTSTGNNVKLASGANYTGTLSDGSMDTRNANIDTVTGSVSGGDLYIDAKLGNTNTIDTLGGVSDATVKEINVLGTEYGTAESTTLALGTGATLDPNVQINGMNYYTDVDYNSTTGNLTLSNKLVNTSGLYDKLGANWTGGNYIKNAANYANAADATHLTVGGALTALDTQVKTNADNIATINASDVMTSGIDATKVAQIATNATNIATNTGAIANITNGTTYTEAMAANVKGTIDTAAGTGLTASGGVLSVNTATAVADGNTSYVTSDLLYDQGYQNATQVDTKITTALANGGDAYQTASQVTTSINTALDSYTTTAGMNTALNGKAETDLSNLSAAGTAVITNNVKANAATGTYSATGEYADNTIGKAIQTNAANIALKADAENVYTKAEADGLLNAKMNTADWTVNAGADLNGAKLANGSVASTALASDVQTTLGNATTAYTAVSNATTTVESGNTNLITSGGVYANAENAAYTNSASYADGTIGKAIKDLQGAGYQTSTNVTDAINAAKVDTVLTGNTTAENLTVGGNAVLTTASNLNGAKLTSNTVAESALSSDLADKINGKADSATTLAGYGITDAINTSAIATTLTGESTDDQVASAKAVYDAISASTSGTGAVAVAVADATTMQHTTQEIASGVTYKNFDENASVTEAVAALDAHTGKVHGLISQATAGAPKQFNGTDVNASKNKDASGNYVGNLAVGTTTEDHLVALDNAIGSLSSLNTTNGVLDNNASVADNLQNLDREIDRVARYTTARNQLSLNQAVAYTDARVDELDKEMSSGIASAVALSSVAVSNVNRGEVSVGAGYGYYNGRSAAAFGAAMGLSNRWSVNAGAGVSDADVSFRAGTNYKFKLF